MIQKQLVVIDIVGLTEYLIGKNTPYISRYANDNAVMPMGGVFPAVTTSAQASILTGVTPDRHGIVGNGWYARDYAEVVFWKQANQLVQAEKVWDSLKRVNRQFTCSKLFWWYNMYANVDASITPRPHYPADGRKIIDLYSTPQGLHQSLEKQLGAFPFFNFWGPKAGIESSQWIADAAMLEFTMNRPNLQLVYLPHLDYCLQKHGPSHHSIARELTKIDAIVGKLLAFYQERGVAVVLLSEYGIDPVDTPVHINRVLRQHGYIAVRESLTWELLDPGASSAFAVADHQIAHVYLNDHSKKGAVKKVLESTPGVDCVLDEAEKKDWCIDHPRAGDLIAVADPNAWFTYYYWMDDSKAPDFARTVDIHRKPGYDPVEMFVDPQISFPTAKVIGRLVQKKLGFRMLMDVIPLDATLVCGSHGRVPKEPQLGPVAVLPKEMAVSSLKMTDLYAMIQRYFT